MSGDDTDRALDALTPPVRSDVIETWRRPEDLPFGERAILLYRMRQDRRGDAQEAIGTLDGETIWIGNDGAHVEPVVLLAWMPAPPVPDRLPWEAP